MIINRQSAAKFLKFNDLILLSNEKGSTTIPWEGSTLYNYIREKPDIIFQNLFDNITYLRNDNNCYIYGILCLNNYKLYVGSTKSLYKRLRKHISLLKNNKHHSKSIQNSYNKYKSNNFYYFIIDSLNSDISNIEVSTIEETYINKFNTVRKGFNDTYNTSRNLISLENISKNIKQQSIKVVELDLNGNFIKIHSSVTNAAKSVNDQSTNISACCKGNLRYVKNRIWIYYKDYNKNSIYKLRDVQKSYISPENAKLRVLKGKKSKKINIFDINNTFIKQVDCPSDLLKFLNLSISGKYFRLIKDLIKDKTPYKAIYKFEYSEDIV